MKIYENQENQRKWRKKYLNFFENQGNWKAIFSTEIVGIVSAYN